ncbi:MAG: right-handed parallel beta-helix repeat-containing protein [Lentimicrobiaceae bacterium]|nr:right-handed parallel beta-helix repeat-containing protein [Lentimicrobiaceae bacterium]
MGRIVLFLIGLLLMASGVMAAIIQVGPGQTYTTIQAAVNAASAGDEIQVAAGTYTEAITIPIGKALTITGANAGVAAGNNPGVRGAETIIDGGIRLLSASTINGISIQNGIQLGSFKYGVSVEADGATVINCIVTNVPNEGGIVTLTNIDNFTLTNSTIQNNYRGIYFNPGGGHSLTGNLIDANNGAGVGIGSDGLSNFTMTGNTISNHTVEGWGASGVGTNVVAEGNSFLNNGVSVAHYGGNAIDASPNYWNGSPSTSGTVTGDPWWADASMTILASNSPVKNVTQSLFYGTIQAAINAATSGDVIEVAAGTYNEDILVNKTLTISGAGQGQSIITGPLGGSKHTVSLDANNIVFEGFTVTRAGNNTTDWGSTNLNDQGILITQLKSGCTIQDCEVTGNRNGIYLNNTQGHTIKNNNIHFNRTGIQFVNDVSNCVLHDNDIMDNWTMGVLFYYSAGFTNISTGFHAYDNNISGNWYSQVESKTVGANTTASYNFRSNWFGNPTPVVTTNPGGEPGYAAQIPVAYGGTASAPATRQGDITGDLSALIDYDPWWADAAMTTLGSNLPVTNITKGLTYSTIQAAINDASAGDVISVAAGTYGVASTILIDEAVTITGPAGGGAIVQGTDAGVVPVFEISSSHVTLQNLEVTHTALSAGLPNPWVELNNSLIRIPAQASKMDAIQILNNKIYVPAQAGAMGTWNAVALTVGTNAVSSVNIDGNTVYNTRNGIIIQSGNTATVSNNVVFHTKGGIMNYTSNLTDGSRTMTGNNWTSTEAGIPDHNEWDMVWNTGGTYTSTDWPLWYQTSVLALSNANNGAYVVDRRGEGTGGNTAGGNRSHIFVDVSSSFNTFHSARGNFNEPFSTIALGITSVVTGGTVYVAAGNYAENVVIDRGLTMHGANTGIACGSRGTESTISPLSGLPVTISGNGVTMNGFEITAPGYQYAINCGNTSNTSILFNNIHDVGTTLATNTNVHSVIYTVANGASTTNLSITDNCFSDISSSNLTGFSASAIGILQSTSTGVLTGLDIERNIINGVTVNTGTWPTGKIAYGIQINTGGGSGYLATTGEVVNATLANNEISNIIGFIATGIGLEGNTLNAQVKNNRIANLTGHKAADRNGGGYDLQGLKFENNRYLATCLVEDNKFETNTYTNGTTIPLGYAVANYVPVGGTYTGGTTGAATLGCNWYGTSVDSEIADNANLDGKIFNKDNCQTNYLPYLTDGTDADPVTLGFQPQPNACGGGSAVANATKGVAYNSIQEAIDAANDGDLIVVSLGGTYAGVIFDESGKSITLQNTSGATVTIQGASPALTVTSGTLTVDGITYTTATNDPTVLVNGGSLIMRNCTVEESTGFTHSGISVSSGSLDAGTGSDHGYNTFVNDDGLALNVTGGTVTAIGNYWGTVDPTAVAALISGTTNYSPWCNEDFSICGYTAGSPVTTIGIPTEVSCGVYDFPVTVQNFNNIGAISLTLNYDPAVLSYTSVTLNTAITGAPVSNPLPGTFILGYFESTGGSISLADDAVLFTLRFTLLPAASGAASVLSWNTNDPAYCEYGGVGPNFDPYVSAFINLSTWNIPVRPVKNVNTSLEYCKIQEAIDATETVNGHVIEVSSGTYDEQVLVNKGITVKGAGPTKPIIDYTGTVSGKPTLIDIPVDNVTIENLNFKVDLSKLRSAIIASGSGIDNITVKSNLIEPYGTAAGSYGDRNAVSINYGGTTNYRTASGGVDNILYQDNTVTLGASSGFRAAIAIDEGNASITGNIATTINHDVLVRFSSGAVTVTGNTCYGGGMEFSDFNLGTGTLTISNNTFDGTIGNTYTNALRLKNNYTARTTIVSDNTFTHFVGNIAGYGGTVSLENYQAITLDGNTFTPLANSTTFRHLTINTKAFGSSSGYYAPVVGATLTNNVFNGSGTPGGVALAFFNWDNDNPTFNAFELGTAGNENTFNAGIGTFILLDNSDGTVLPNNTTMVPWAIDLDATNNKFDVGAGLELPAAMSLENLFALEDKIQHAIDDGDLGFVKVKDLNTYVTVNSFIAPATTTPSIQRGIDAASNGWTVNVNDGIYVENVNVNKQVTVDGYSQSGVIVYPALSGPNPCSGASLCPGASNIFLVQANNVTIKDLTADGNNTSLTSGVLSNGVDVDARNGIITDHTTGSFTNLNVQNVTVQNIYLRGIYFSTTGGSYNFSNNSVSNVAGESNSIGIMGWASTGTISGNTVTNSNDGISLNHSIGTTIANNTVTGCGSGIHTDNNGSGGTGTADIISNNTVSNCGYGIFAFAPYFNVSVDGNTVTNCDVGLTSAGTYSTAAPTFTNNVVDGTGKVNSYGVYSTTEIWGYVSGNQYASFSNNYIQNTSTAFLLCSQSGFTNNTSANNNSITGNTLGVKLAADNTEIPPTGNFGLSMTCNWWGSNTVAGVVTAVGSTDPAVTYDPWLVDGTDNDLVAIGFQPVPNSCTGAANLYVNDLVSDNGTNDTYTTAIGNDANAGTAAAPFLTITKAVNTAVDGTKIWVDAGTFQEQVSINKTLDLTGVDRTRTIIKAPVTLSGFANANGTSFAIIYASGNTNTINIDKLMVDGDGGRTDASFVGVHYFAANGSFTNSRITGIRNNPYSGSQGGSAFTANHQWDVPINQTVYVTDNIIDDYQKGGIVINELNTQGIVTGNIVTGQNIPLVNAQNGIQFGFGAYGTITGNTVTNNIWNKVEHPHQWTAAGILLAGVGVDYNNTATGNITIVGNNILNGNENALSSGAGGYGYNSNLGLTINSNTFSNNKIHVGLADAGTTTPNAGDTYDKYVLNPAQPNWVFGCIQYAIDEATAGDVLNASAGTFIENVNVHTSVSLNGAASLASIIDGGGAGTVVTIAANNTTLNGFKVHNSGATATDAGVKLTDGGMTGVTGCTITNNEITTFNGLGIIGGSANSLTLNNIHNNAAYGALLIGTSGNTIESNTISNTGLDGIALDNASAVGGPLSIGSTGNFIKSNTISNGGRDGIFIGENCSGNYITDGNVLNTIASIGINVWRPSGQTITDNSITNALTGIRLLGSSNNTITGNTLTTNGTGIIIDPSWQSGVWYSSNNNTISGNTIAGNTLGMDADDVNQNLVTAEINWWGDASGPYHATLNPCGLGNAVTDNVDFSPWYFQSGMTTLNGIPPVTMTAVPDYATVTGAPVIFSTTAGYTEDMSGYDDQVLTDNRITSTLAFPAGSQVISVKYDGTEVLAAPYDLVGKTTVYLSEILGLPAAGQLNDHTMAMTPTWTITVAGFDGAASYGITLDAVSYITAASACNNVLGTEPFSVTFADLAMATTDPEQVCEGSPVISQSTVTYPSIAPTPDPIPTNPDPIKADVKITFNQDIPDGAYIEWTVTPGMNPPGPSTLRTYTFASTLTAGTPILMSSIINGSLPVPSTPGMPSAPWPLNWAYVTSSSTYDMQFFGLTPAAYTSAWTPIALLGTAEYELGFTGTTTQAFTVNDCGISGVLNYYNNASSLLKNVPVSLYQNGNPVLDGASNPIVSTTDATLASYSFTSLPAGTYELRPAKIDEVRSINATDAAQVNYWNVNNSPIEKVRFLAGDVARPASGSSSIVAYDAQQILVYFVSAGTHVWTNAPSWSFYNAGQTISANPWAESIYPKVTITNAPMTNQTIYGMVTGDFNRSWTPSSKGASQSLSLNDGQMVQVAPNTEILLPITAAHTMEVGAISLILTYPDDKVTIDGVYLGNNPTQPMLYNANNGVVRIGWTSPMPMELLTGNTLFTLKLRTASNLGSNETIRFELAADPLNELANGQSQVISPASLIADLLVTSTTGLADMQGSNLQLTCYPNPFTETTTIHYYLPVKGFVTLDLFDLVGQKVTSLVAQHADAGSHSLCLQSTSISSGVYLARITFRYEGQTFTRTIKLVRQD